MESLTNEEIQNLKGAFSEKWPDATHALKNPSYPQHVEAACLWLGFKEGYAFHKKEGGG